ncbi:unnamed protein product, partial [Arabidopsis halleri]
MPFFKFSIKASPPSCVVLSSRCVLYSQVKLLSTICLGFVSKYQVFFSDLYP